MMSKQYCYVCKKERPSLSVEALKYFGWTVRHFENGQNEWICSKCVREGEMNNCDHSKTTITEDIGWDIYPTDDGDVIEERQHLERCSYCGARRLIFQPASLKDGELPEGKSEWKI